MNHTTKIALATATLLAMTGIGKSNAQVFMVWDGDSRFGLSVGANHNFKPFVLTTPTGYTLDGDGSTAIICPSIGLYSGMEKKLSGSLSFGYDGTASYIRHTAYATLKNAAGSTYDYTFSANTITMNENIYFAFAPDRMAKTQFNIGAGVYERVMFGGKATSESDVMAPPAEFGEGSSFGFSLGIAATAGITYYLSDVFFVKGTIDALIPLLSNSKFDEDWNNIWGNSNSSSLTVSPDSGFELGVSACIGFKW